MRESERVKGFLMTVSVRSVEEREEYQRVSTNVEKGLSVIQEELHRMRMATKAQVDSLAIEREVRSRWRLF